MIQNPHFPTTNMTEVSTSRSKACSSIDLASMAFSKNKALCPKVFSPNVHDQECPKEMRRKVVRPRRRSLVQASKITDWLKEAPSQNVVPAAPPLSQSPTVISEPSDPNPQEASKKTSKRRRRKTKMTLEERRNPSLDEAIRSFASVPDSPNGVSIVDDDRSTPHNSAPRDASAAVVEFSGLSASSVSGSDAQEMVSKHGCADFK